MAISSIGGLPVFSGPPAQSAAPLEVSEVDGAHENISNLTHPGLTAVSVTIQRTPTPPYPRRLSQANLPTGNFFHAPAHASAGFSNAGVDGLLSRPASPGTSGPAAPPSLQLKPDPTALFQRTGAALAFLGGAPSQPATRLPPAGEPEGPDEESHAIEAPSSRYRLAAAPAAAPAPFLQPARRPVSPPVAAGAGLASNPSLTPDWNTSFASRPPLNPSRLTARPSASHALLRPTSAWQRPGDSKVEPRSVVRLPPVNGASHITITTTVVVRVQPNGAPSSASNPTPPPPTGPLFMPRVVRLQLGSSPMLAGFRPVDAGAHAPQPQSRRLGASPPADTPTLLLTSSSPSPLNAEASATTPVPAVNRPAPSPDSSYPLTALTAADAPPAAQGGIANVAGRCDSCRDCCSKFWSCLSYYFCCKWL